MDGAPAIGETLLWGTPYRARRRLGRGGAGEVFEAEHIGLAKPVVVKLLHADLSDVPRLVERMRVEAQVLARLSHPNLVVVTDFGQTAEGRSFLVMERLEGRTLAEELAVRGALPTPEAVALVRQALSGLAAAHGAGVVHRDVKPENLFVCAPDAEGRRRLKVLDFGVAKLLEEGARFPTEQGVLVGSPRCAAPEQVLGGAVDGRTDVYAAGVVLYTLLSGRGPFDHATRVEEVLRAHVAEVPAPPSRVAPQEIPAALDRAVLRALEKDPARRFPGAAAFAAELERIEEGMRAEAGAGAVVGGQPRWARTEPMDPRAAAMGAAWSTRRRRAAWGRRVLLGLLLTGALLLGFVLAALLRPWG